MLQSSWDVGSETLVFKLWKPGREMVVWCGVVWCGVAWCAAGVVRGWGSGGAGGGDGCVSEYFDLCDLTTTHMFVCVCLCVYVFVCVCMWSCKYLSQDEFIKETVCINL